MFCECGCGKLTPLARRTRRDLGHVKGQPLKFIRGHNGKGEQRERRPLAERFWAKVAKGEPDECWEWRGGTNVRGYGRVMAEDRRHLQAHRVAYALANGPVPDGLFVLHTCDNPGCCNPAHLRLGTHAENMAEMTARHRSAVRVGELANSSKLTIEQARAIKAARGARGVDLARQYGVSVATISMIRSGKRWAHA